MDDWLVGDPQALTRINATGQLLEMLYYILDVIFGEGSSVKVPEPLIAFGSNIIIVLRRSAKEAPDSYSGFLAGALNIFGELIREDPRLLKDAVSLSEEAVAITRALHHNDPDTHSSDLSRYLNTLKEAYVDFYQDQHMSVKLASEAINVLRSSTLPTRTQTDFKN